MMGERWRTISLVKPGAQRPGLERRLATFPLFDIVSEGELLAAVVVQGHVKVVDLHHPLGLEVDLTQQIVQSAPQVNRFANLPQSVQLDHPSFQVGEQLRVAQGDGRLAGEQGQQPFVLVAEGAGRVGIDHIEHAQHLVVAHEGHAHDSAEGSIRKGVGLAGKVLVIVDPQRPGAQGNLTGHACAPRQHDAVIVTSQVVAGHQAQLPAIVLDQVDPTADRAQ